MPFKPGVREYRNFSMGLSPVKDEGSPYTVRGYATTFDQPYDFGYDGARERVLRSALDGADMSDVIFQLNHEGPVMARMRNGSLKIELDDHGMGIEAALGGSSYGRDLYEAIGNGLIDRMSWGFLVDEGGWEYDPDARLFTITRVKKVFDVSAVSLPADEDTEIYARSYIDGVIEAERRQEMSQREQQEERIRLASLLRITR